jgi:hypothetical protein
MKTIFKNVLLALLILTSTQIFAQVPVFNSNPSASAVLLLDFDGHTVSGTSWNSNGPITCAGAGLTNTQITEIFNRIAEDYIPFNINVTTDETKYAAAPSNRRMRTLFTITNEWYGSGAGGVAYIGSFTWGDNTPCFIFTKLLNYNTKYISEAGAHEAGHTFSLRHQASYDANCLKTSDYNYGVGTAQFGWAPIMGVGYYRNSTTWFNGPNPYGCNTVQSDADVIANISGIGYRTDDVGESFQTALAQSFTNNNLVSTSMIGTPSDKDMFTFTLTSPKRITINAVPTSVGANDAGSNLDVKLEIYNTGRTLIGTYNPPLALTATVDTTLDAGTYYYTIEGVSNQFTPKYGSIGSYTVTVEQIPLVILPVRKLELKGMKEGNVNKLTWNIDADEAITAQTLEVSTDGRSFETVAAPTTTSRAYNHLPAASSVYYRLSVNFDNGRQYYSNIIAMRNNGIENRPQLFTNMIRTNSLMINSPSNFSYTIADYSGRTIQQGIAIQGATTISINNISNGAYIIRFTNGRDHYVEKFVKQ